MTLASFRKNRTPKPTHRAGEPDSLRLLLFGWPGGPAFDFELRVPHLSSASADVTGGAFGFRSFIENCISQFAHGQPHQKPRL